MSRKGLFIGIDQYVGCSPLGGCVNDAISMATVLSRHADGRLNIAARTITSDTASCDALSIKNAIQELFKGKCNLALLYFAGHGSFDEDIEEGLIIPSDYKRGMNEIRISDILNWANAATEIENKVIILDCCQAGSAGENRALRHHASVIGSGVTIMTACSRLEYASEIDGHGVFTSLLQQALQGGANNVLGHVTTGSLYSFVDSALGPWEQRPIFKTNIASFCALREMVPLVPLNTLRRLPEWFADVHSEYPLTPQHEDTVSSHDPNLVAIFKQLQNCNRHSLVEPVDAEHMYYAAINSKTCRLTALGAYYHSLVVKGRI